MKSDDTKARLRHRQKAPPQVRLARPTNRAIQLRYFCPDQKREIRISTGTRDEDEALRQKQELEAKLLLERVPNSVK